MRQDFPIIASQISNCSMGRGDKKTKKGKIWKDSYGNSRNKKAIKAKLKRTASKKPVAAVVAGTDTAAKPKKVASKKKEA